MHTITTENKAIKLVFDKNTSSWQYDKQNIKYGLDSYKDHVSILICPTTAKNFSFLIQRYSEDDNFMFTDKFLQDYKQELIQDQELAIKRKLLKEKLTLENIQSRPYLLDYSHLPEDIRKPFAHQQLELEHAVRFPAFYSLDEMRLGKTRVAIERHRFLKENLNRIDKSFIICPVTLMYTWANEIQKWMPKDKASYLMITGTRENKLLEIGLMKDKVDFFIINFEGVSSIKEELLNLINSRTNIIIDEFIKIKNPSAKRAKNLIDIGLKTEYIMGLCGTPVSQGSIDLFSPNLIIDKGRKFGFSYERFIEKYFTRNGWNLVPKHSAHELISDKLYENAIRFTRDMCFDMPDKLYIPLHIPLPPENQSVYNQMVTFAMAELEGKEVSAPIILVQLLRLSQITSGFLKTPEGKILRFKEQPKIQALRENLEVNNGKPLIIWSRFIPEVKMIAELLQEMKISFGCIVGSAIELNEDERQASNNIDPSSPLGKLLAILKPEANTIEAIKEAYREMVKKLHPDLNQNVSKEDIDLLKKINNLYTSVNRFQNIELPKDMNTSSFVIPDSSLGIDAFTRQSIVERFQKGKIQVIIGTAASGGEGLKLSRAQDVIYMSNSYVLKDRLQSEDRAQDVVEKHKVSYTDIVCQDTIDIGILQILMGKKSVADVITKDNLRNMAKGGK
ncbi:MAG: Helicase domain protein [candidate division WS6 bacterium GW2011_GWA2_37_6]|uniref:Helicase domain protein n=1 Tax=candidate division WS6 bacterium GW2011_GWA2_37_6 TaxID=1619087 RepID=A0A0G0K1U0_9BACT|nr:MAG: Helicase domain protein [candidate division WS6 bacterium GW2011_GWA2_37_6]